MKVGYKVLLNVVLIGAFCVQVWDGFFKFIKRQTTIVTKKTIPTSMRLPAIRLGSSGCNYCTVLCNNILILLDLHFAVSVQATRAMAKATKNVFT